MLVRWNDRSLYCFIVSLLETDKVNPGQFGWMLLPSFWCSGYLPMAPSTANRQMSCSQEIALTDIPLYPRFIARVQVS